MVDFSTRLASALALQVEDVVFNLTEAGVPMRTPSRDYTLWERIQLYRDLPKLEDLPPAGAGVSSATPEAELKLTDDQQRAWDKLQKFLTSKDRYFVLKGFAGTGKSFLMKKLLTSGGDFYFTAPTNKAAKVLSQFLGIQARTVYSVLGIRMEAEDEELVLTYPTKLPRIENSILVIDECSMVGNQLLEFLVRVAEELNLKLIFVGDPAQLRPIGELTSPVWRLQEDPECRALLREVVRYDSHLLTLATAIRGQLKAKDYSINLTSLSDGTQVRKLGRSAFDKELAELSDSNFRVIAWRNKTVNAYNNLIREARGFTEDFCKGDQLLLASVWHHEGGIIANTDEELLVTDAVLDTVSVGANRIPIQVWKLSVDIDLDGTNRIMNIVTERGFKALNPYLAKLASEAKKAKPMQRKALWNQFWETKQRFQRVRYGFALTSHRAQGSTYEHVYVDQRDILANPDSREAFQSLYVASSRASETVTFN